MFTDLFFSGVRSFQRQWNYSYATWQRAVEMSGRTEQGGPVPITGSKLWQKERESQTDPFFPSPTVDTATTNVHFVSELQMLAGSKIAFSNAT